ncbi:MAG TPA: hypothetical protein VFB29_01375 [Pseudolabrys sp.]|nr:hypothetical protein [Pseudolabrys sp.]
MSKIIAERSDTDERTDEQTFFPDIPDAWLEATGCGDAPGGYYTEFAYCTRVLCPG